MIDRSAGAPVSSPVSRVNWTQSGAASRVSEEPSCGSTILLRSAADRGGPSVENVAPKRGNEHFAVDLSIRFFALTLPPACPPQTTGWPAVSAILRHGQVGGPGVQLTHIGDRTWVDSVGFLLADQPAAAR